MPDIMDTIYSRRSIQKYQGQKVEKEKLELLLMAAMAAPSASNNQPWEFVVLTNENAMETLRLGLEYGHKNITPLNVIVVGYPAEQKDPHTQYEAGRVHWETY